MNDRLIGYRMHRLMLTNFLFFKYSLMLAHMKKSSLEYNHSILSVIYENLEDEYGKEDLSKENNKIKFRSIIISGGRILNSRLPSVLIEPGYKSSRSVAFFKVIECGIKLFIEELIC